MSLRPLDVQEDDAKKSEIFFKWKKTLIHCRRINDFLTLPSPDAHITLGPIFSLIYFPTVDISTIFPIFLPTNNWWLISFRPPLIFDISTKNPIFRTLIIIH